MSVLTSHRGVVYALAAAALFGISTPFAKILTGEIPATLLAGLLYLGSGLGLGICLLLRPKQIDGGNPLRAPDLPWLAGAIVFGGIAGPLLLMAALQRMPGSSASLLLNLEGVLTALLAWIVFRENFDRRILLGMLLIVAAGILLAFEPGVALGLSQGALLVAGACACWAVDNNFTRKIAAGDALQIAAVKGGVAGLVNLGIAFSLHETLPALPSILAAGAIGFAGYGLSLVLFVLALRHLGTARTGAYFSAAPFVGAVVSLLVLRESPGFYFWAAAVLMAIGIVLHLRENHGHAHLHKVQSHAHPHEHDEHHRHTHDAGQSLDEPHTHAHQHQPLKHTHGHFPDIHHRHEH
jgi:drug/metabolite transporter (DMT)-like permease